MKFGVIYKIEISENDIYVGSTTQILCKRQSNHNSYLKKYPKRKLYKSCIENDIDKIKCIWVADVSYNSNEELRMVEEQYRKELNGNLNMVRCHITEEEKLEYQKDYRENNKDKLLDLQKEYREKNKNEIIERGKKYYENNKNKITETHKKYYENNKEKTKEYNKKYYENKKLNI
tara:strand:- start:32 stop:556 length:525 start_codon:yes stop_codon:yes gene_type:complete